MDVVRLADFFGSDRRQGGGDDRSCLSFFWRQPATCTDSGRSISMRGHSAIRRPGRLVISDSRHTLEGQNSPSGLFQKTDPTASTGFLSSRHSRQCRPPPFGYLQPIVAGSAPA